MVDQQLKEVGWTWLHVGKPSLVCATQLGCGTVDCVDGRGRQLLQPRQAITMDQLCGAIGHDLMEPI